MIPPEPQIVYPPACFIMAIEHLFVKPNYFPLTQKALLPAGLRVRPKTPVMCSFVTVSACRLSDNKRIAAGQGSSAAVAHSARVSCGAYAAKRGTALLPIAVQGNGSDRPSAVSEMCPESPKGNMHLVATADKFLMHIRIIIAVINADMLLTLRPWQHYCIQNIYNLCLIVLIGRTHRCRNRNAGCFS